MKRRFSFFFLSMITHRRRWWCGLVMKCTNEQDWQRLTNYYIRALNFTTTRPQNDSRSSKNSFQLLIFDQTYEMHCDHSLRRSGMRNEEMQQHIKIKNWMIIFIHETKEKNNKRVELESGQPHIGTGESVVSWAGWISSSTLRRQIFDFSLHTSSAVCMFLADSACQFKFPHRWILNFFSNFTLSFMFETFLVCFVP